MALDDQDKNRRRQARFQKANLSPSPTLAKRHSEFISRVASGESQAEAAWNVGVKPVTVEQWKSRYAEFGYRLEKAVQKAKGNHEVDFVPFDAAFRRKFFTHDEQPAATPPHMQKLIDVINEQVEIAERERRRDRRVLILLPPEHGKSTVAVEEYIAYRTCMDPTFRSSIVCSTATQAEKRLGAIARMLTDRSAYANLIDTYGPFRSEQRTDQKPWRSHHFTHLRAPANQRDFTCQALGWTGEIYGDRNDLIVFDDIASQKNQTPAVIEAMWEKIWGEFRTRIRKGGLFLVVGTRVREGDIYSVMEEKGFFTDKVVMPAIAREPGTLSESDPGEALWEEGTSMKELLTIRETDLRLFELQYQQNPLPSVGAVFALDAIESCYDDTRKIGDIPEGSIVVAGIDPSVSNYTAGVVFAMKHIKNGEYMRYLVDVWNEKNLTGDGDKHAGVVQFVVELCRTYGVKILCVEDGTWMSLINNAFTLRSQLYDLGVDHVPIPVNEQTVGPEAIRQLSGLFNHGLINLPGTQGARQKLNSSNGFVNQLLTWTGKKTHWRQQNDIIKAFRQAEHAAKRLISGSSMTSNIADPLRPAYMKRQFLAPRYMRKAV